VFHSFVLFAIKVHAERTTLHLLQKLFLK